MCDCDFKTAAPDTAPLDPRKRVRYFAGLVLGPEELQQEAFYLMERDHLHQRSLHGYGTVLGLGVRVEDDAGGRPQVLVDPGLAVTPRGRSVCVPQAQCAVLDDWLAAHGDELAGEPGGSGSPPGSPPEGPLTLWVVLCHRECETDPVPVLGDPCRTPEDATAASRLADDFELRLETVAPEHQEEAAVRLLGELLRAVEVTDAGGPYLGPDELAALVRRLAPAGSPPELPTLAEVLAGTAGGSPASPPASPGAGATLRLHPDDAAEALRAAWREWVAFVRPALAAAAAGCAGGGGHCVLLARLDLAVTTAGGAPRVDGAVAVDDEDRPWLLHTRLLQEWLPAWAQGLPPLGSPPGAPLPGPPPVGPEIHAGLAGLEADDHPHYLLVDAASRALVADLDADGHRIVGLGEAAAPGPDDAVRWSRAVKVDDPAGGDLAGTYPNPQVTGLQGNPVAPAAPAPDDVLVWNGAAWSPGAPPASGVPDLLDEGLVRIVELSWRHGTAFNRLQLTHDGAPVRGVALAFGDGEGGSALVRSATLDGRALRLWMRQQAANTPFFQHLEVPVEVVPAQVVTSAGGRIVETAPADEADRAPAVVLLVEANVADLLVEQRAALRVEVLGDFVLDLDDRAIDAEHVRAELPTGDRRSGAGLGIQGGRFESWLTAGRLQVGPIDLNLADAGELTELPGIGSVLAGRIVEARQRLGGFDDLDDLRVVAGVSNDLIRRLRARMEG